MLAAAVLAVIVAGGARLAMPADKAEAGLATNVQVISQTCTNDGYVRINLAWTAPNEGGQWVDLSLQPNGFAPGTFLGIGPFGAYDGFGTWAGLIPGMVHYLRINNVTPFGWTPSQTLSFQTRGDCGGFISYNPYGQMPFNPSVFSQQCLPDGRVRVFFNTGGAVAPGPGQFVPNVMYADLSLTDARFIPGSFIGYGQVGMGAPNFSWDGLVPGRVHFFRLNGYGQTGWMPSQVVTFTTIAC
jgi:hypothetical protein